MGQFDLLAAEGSSGSELKIKAGVEAGGTFSTVSGSRVKDVVFGTAFANTDYAITITGSNVRSWSYESKVTTGFRIQSNSAAAIGGEVSWHAIENGETT
jgi:hypothetical protein